MFSCNPLLSQIPELLKNVGLHDVWHVDLKEFNQPREESTGPESVIVLIMSLMHRKDTADFALFLITIHPFVHQNM